jgi:hypothetical protein
MSVAPARAHAFRGRGGLDGRLGVGASDWDWVGLGGALGREREGENGWGGKAREGELVEEGGGVGLVVGPAGALGVEV